MDKRTKEFFRYFGMLLFMALLLWLSFRNLSVEDWKAIRVSHPSYLFYATVFAIVSHYIRAERWRLLLQPAGYKPGRIRAFYSVMIGYFINLALPRAGELSRCINLYRVSRVPVNTSLGTVMAERVIDVVFLFVFIIVSFFIEFDKLYGFFRDLNLWKNVDEDFSYYAVFIPISIVSVIVSVIFIYRSTIKQTLLYKKVHVFLSGLKSGLFTVFHLKRTSIFVLYSLLIWVLYFFMNFIVFFAFPETSHLNMYAGLTIFVIGGIAMALPLPGGFGSFHYMVALGLTTLYSIHEDVAPILVTIFHSVQVFAIILFGSVSFVASFIIEKKSASTALEDA